MSFINTWKKFRQSKIYEYLEVIVIALSLALVIRTFVIQAYKIPSGSMIPTLQVGDHLFVSKFAYGIKIPFTEKKILKFKSPQRKDIIVFKCPVDPSKDFIKRMIGLSKEEIMIKEKKVYINQKSIEEPYVIKSISSFKNIYSIRDNWEEPLIVPKNKYFVMGDNRDSSYDSRFWGFLSEEMIKGKALFIYWPPNRISLIR
ncbi:signal peptidase I [bacterium]|nr:signal peptidase I [bacterium]MBU0900064.1 signal peptidase I [bacterium]MBU1153040.1 signal peptidase I [bacterium]MBU2599240.1 signal peptidase I [bacterium]